MRLKSVPNIVYSKIFPDPRPEDPPSFAAFLSHLVKEVREEIQIFYGVVDCDEAKYPGLDYTHPPHRMRLGRFPYHRQLFDAFDNLGLTKGEILSLCRWEGTRWAREEYEREEGVKVQDTTGDDIPTAESLLQGGTQNETEPIPSVVEDDEDQQDTPREEIVHETGSQSDEEIQSVGLVLNQRLRAAAEARERGANEIMDEAWEQWLKEATERGFAGSAAAVRASVSLPISSTPLRTVPNASNTPTAFAPPTGTATG